MALDLILLANKLKNYREQFEISHSELSKQTGINLENIMAYENAEKMPTGDEILILSDYYKCDYKFFISNERLAPFEQTDKLFRRYGEEFSKGDRWAVQEILFLTECEYFLLQSLNIKQELRLQFEKRGTFYKKHGEEAAKALRELLKYKNNAVPMDIYQDFRSIGIHIFRRKLNNSNISGLYIKHPAAGKCILINYSEDIYRQRFTAAHEAAHAILDGEEDFIVSFIKWKKEDLVEIRASTFASNYLMPSAFLERIPDAHQWDAEKALLWANKLKVNTEAFAYALSANNFIDKKTEHCIKNLRIPKEEKCDPELPKSLSPRANMQKRRLLELGLSSHYVHLCFEAYRRNIISSARMAEMLLINEKGLGELSELYGGTLKYAD